MADGSAGKAEDYSLGGLAEKFIWECPENLPDRLSQTALPLKRKISPLEGSNRRPRGDNSPSETVGQNTFSRGSGPPIVPAGPSHRDSGSPILVHPRLCMWMTMLLEKEVLMLLVVLM